MDANPPSLTAHSLELTVPHLPAAAQIMQLVEADTVAATRRRDPQRWRHCHVADNPLAADIVARVWGRATELTWQILATALIAQRLEDNEPTPRTSADPLAAELEMQINQECQTLNRTLNSTT
ncbi:hypothetical protein AB0C34_17910 [Nocardia sp. NPDC049220]|uniref:hypothetical protein n=1 Tax=Nocardia sp. NPDC049220 TaxID=3155273 RepID=UPI00340282C1